MSVVMLKVQLGMTAAGVLRPRGHTSTNKRHVNVIVKGCISKGVVVDSVGNKNERTQKCGEIEISIQLFFVSISLETATARKE